MENPYGPKIETMEDWNESLGCCCEMPLADAPIKECESVSAAFIGRGYTDPEDTEPRLYKKRIITEILSSSGSTTSTASDGTSYTSHTRSTDASTTITDTYSELYEFSVGGGGCDGGVPEITEECEASGSSSRDVFSKKFWGVSDSTTGKDSTLTFTVADTETPCVYEITQRFQLLAHSAGYNSDGSPAGDDEDPVVVVTTVPLDQVITAISLVVGGDSGETKTTATTYEDSSTRAAWISLAGGLASSKIGLPNAACAGTECSSKYEVAENDFQLEKRNVRYRWRVPVSHLGTYYKITWDVLEEPEGWNAEPPTASRSFYMEDQTWEWEGPGNLTAPDGPSWKSGWYDLPPPSVPGRRRVVNVRFEILDASIYGAKPQVTGEGVEL